MGCAVQLSSAVCDSDGWLVALDLYVSVFYTEKAE